MFDFASVQIQRLTVEYLETVKDHLSQKVVGYVKTNALFDPKTVDDIYNRHDFKNSIKYTCALFQIQLSAHLTDDCETIATKGRELIMSKASSLSYIYTQCQKSEEVTPELLQLCSTMGIDGSVLDLAKSYRSEFD